MVDDSSVAPRSVSPPWGRRTVLRGVLASGAALLAATVAGCADEPTHTPSAPGPLIGTLTQSRGLVSRYEATLARHDELATELQTSLANHRAHAAELERLAGGLAPAGSANLPGVPSTQADALRALLSAERAAAQQASSACAAAPGRYAGALASIAACRSSHLTVITQLSQDLQ